MNKTVTLYPKYISTGASLDGVIGNGTRAGGEDYRTVPASSMLYVGTIAFNTNPLLNLSTACTLKNYDIAFNQRCGVWTGGTELYWEFIPKRLTNVEYGDTLPNGGVYLNKFTAYDMSQSSAISKTNGGDYLDGGRSRTLYSGSYKDLIGYSWNLLGFYLQANNPAAFKYKLYLKDLYATVTYEAKYHVAFYDDDGSSLSSQTVNGGERATAPNVSREGYTVVWSCDGKSGTYSASSLPTSEDTDLVFRAVYNPIPKVLGVTVPQKGQLNVYKAVSNAWQLQEGSLEHGKHYYTFYYGDHIKVETVGCNDLSEDLIAELTNQAGDPVSSTTIDGGSGTTLKVFESNSYTANRILTVTPQPHYFTITTVAGAGGTITTTHRVARTGSTTINVKPTPNSGYRIASVKVDNVAQTIANDQSFSYSFTNVQADHTVEATFERIQYIITFDLPQGVSVTANGTAVSGNSLTVDHGDEIEFEFSCGDDLSLTGLFLDDIEDSLMDPVFKQVKTAAHTIFYVDGAHTLKATATSDLATVTIQQTTGGTVTCDKGEGKFVKGTGQKITLSYATDANYVFVRWFDNIREYPKRITVDSDVTAYAVFEYRPLSVDVEIDAWEYKGISFSGTVEKSADFVEQGESVTLTAHPDTGARFYMWNWFEIEGGIRKQKSSEENPLALVWNNVQSGKVTAKFFPDMHTLTVNAENGEVDVDGTLFYTGETIQLKATPAEGYYFSHWSDEPSNTSAQRVYTMPQADTEITAVFKKVKYKVSVTDGKEYYPEHGDDLLIPFTAEYGYKLADVLLDGNSVFDSVTLTRRGGTLFLENVTSPHTVEVVFKARIYTNGRKLLDYYPPVIASIVDIQRLMAAFQVENDAMWDAISFAMENQYIETATDEGVSMWERELGIIPAATDTLNQRKARLRLKWVPSNNFTTKWLHGWLESVCGTDVPWPEVEGYTLKVTLPWFATWWSIFNDLRTYKPANIVLDPNVALPEDSGNLYAGFAMQTDYYYEVDGETAEPLYDEIEDAPAPPPGNIGYPGTV